MIAIVITFLFTCVFGIISLFFYKAVLASFKKYTEAKQGWLKSIGEYLLKNVKEAREKLIYDVLLFFCLFLETLMFLASFIFSIYIRFNPF